MAKSKKPAATWNAQPRIRVQRGRDIAFGPGKAELLGHLDETRSLNQAAKAMGMSYMKAWLLVRTMNRSFKKPLVKSARGGAQGGGAELTPAGRKVLALYREMQRAGAEAMAPSWKELRRQLKS
ncbi:MAG: winged helix-turn-helix domain-containing protein [Chthoniobacterales bacterium]